MKTIKILSTLVLSALLFVSCNNRETTENRNDEIRLASGKAEVTKAPVLNPDYQIAADQLVGVYVSEVDGSTPYNPNVSYKADGNGGLAVVNTADKQFYPQSRNNVKLSAYHPFNSGTEDIYEFTVKTNQESLVDYCQSDLLYFATTELERKKTAHNLEFEHKLSKIAFTVTAGPGAESTEGAKVTFANIQTTASFNRLTGELTAVTGTPSTMTPNASFGVIIVPQTLPLATQFIKIELTSGRIYQYAVKNADIIFESGKEYKYDIRIGNPGITLTTTVNDWIYEDHEQTGEMEE